MLEIKLRLHAQIKHSSALRKPKNCGCDFEIFSDKVGEIKRFLVDGVDKKDVTKWKKKAFDYF